MTFFVSLPWCRNYKFPSEKKNAEILWVSARACLTLYVAGTDVHWIQKQVAVERYDIDIWDIEFHIIWVTAGPQIQISSDKSVCWESIGLSNPHLSGGQQ